MTTNEQYGTPALVHGIVGIGHGPFTDWSVQCEDANGGEWVMEFRGTDGFDEADDFAQALREAVRLNDRRADRGLMLNAIIIRSVYVETTDTYRVVFGDYSIPLSITTSTCI